MYGTYFKPKQVAPYPMYANSQEYPSILKNTTIQGIAPVSMGVAGRGRGYWAEGCTLVNQKLNKISYGEKKATPSYITFQ